MKEERKKRRYKDKRKYNTKVRMINGKGQMKMIRKKEMK